MRSTYKLYLLTNSWEAMRTSPYGTHPVKRRKQIVENVSNVSLPSVVDQHSTPQNEALPYSSPSRLRDAAAHTSQSDRHRQLGSLWQQRLWWEMGLKLWVATKQWMRLVPPYSWKFMTALCKVYLTNHHQLLTSKR